MKLEYAGELSTFVAELPSAEPGSYTLRILAANPKASNFAMYESELMVEERRDE